MIIEIILLLLAIPTGFLIAWLARDELVSGRKWFRVLIVVSVLVIIWSWLTSLIYIVWTMGFILIVALISLIKSKDRKWTRSKI